MSESTTVEREMIIGFHRAMRGADDLAEAIGRTGFAAKLDAIEGTARNMRAMGDAMVATMESFGASMQAILKLADERYALAAVSGRFRTPRQTFGPRLATSLRRKVRPRPVVCHRVSPRRNRANSRPGGKTAARRAA